MSIQRPIQPALIKPVHLNTPYIETKRLILRKMTEEDLQAVFMIYKDQDVNEFLPWFPLHTLEEAKTLLENKYLKAYQLPRGYMYAICLKSDNIPIGYVHIEMDESHDLGYGLRKEFWHQGITTEAVQAVLKQAQEDGLPYVTATHDINNINSGKVMKKLQMNYQYSYEELWQPKNKMVTFRMYQLNLDGNQKRVYKKYWDMYPEHYIEENI